ncbi:alpha/beta fold hydrolase [Marinovum sp.]|uniref:alpha/beta fold hydrolase n=1 Tax=Marinovum sp. TaxID=2024839 RepID=UPI003A8E2420
MSEPVSDILLIHGSGHGAWCFEPLIGKLQALGHSARAIDLPGAGDDPTPPAEVTLARYAEAICAALGRNTLLLGHSAAGYAITAAAERAPERIARLVYLCAYVPEPGRSMLDLMRDAPRRPLHGRLTKSDDGLCYSAPAEVAEECFYHDCTEAQRAFAIPRLSPQPIAPQAEVVNLSKVSQSLPRSYILCRDDRTIPPEHQAAMTAGWPRADVHELASGHSPFLSMPAELAALIDRLARQ